jgi:vacuolar-type H+-ATPase subunit H
LANVGWKGVFAVDILYLVDRLEEMINEGWHIPLTTNVVLDEEEFLDIIDQMRISVPEEIKQAKRIQQERDRLVSQAKDEADRMLALAREQNQALLSDHELIRAAEAQKQAIIVEGHREIQAMRKDADVYVAEVLGQLEDQLSGLIRTVHNGIVALQQQTPESAAREKASASVDLTSEDRENPELGPETGRTKT